VATAYGALPPGRARGHETFIWVSNLHEHVAGGAIDPPKEGPRYTPGSRYHDDPDRVPFDPALGYADDFVGLTHRALSIGKCEEEPYRSLLALLLDCPAAEHGRRVERQCRGASYKQLAAIAYMVPMSKAERCVWYDVAHSIPLSDAHAHHMLSNLKEHSA
jgi:hypothetical protein